MEMGFPDSSSKHAEQGTAAHELAQTALQEGKDCVAYEGRIFNGYCAGYDDSDSEIDINNVQAYVDYCRRVLGQYSNAEMHIERRVDFRRPMGLPTSGPDADQDEGFGTADCIILAPSEGNNPELPGALHVIDLKYGAGVQVEATDNQQMQFYALGALAEYDLVADFDEIHMHIAQPRRDHFDEWVISKAELMAFAEQAQAKAAEVLKLVTYMPHSDTVKAALNPGEYQCRWCKAKARAVCPAVRDQVFGAVFGEGDFGNLDVVEALTEDDIALTNAVGAQARTLDIYMSKLGLIEDWMKAIRGEVERLLFEGVEFENWKLVQGRQGARKWRDEQAVVAMLKKHRLKKGEIFEEKLISVATAEKRFQKTLPRTWDHLQTLITRADGQPSVAPKSDKRPAYQPVKDGELADLDGSDLV